MSEHWLTVEEVASLMGITDRVVRKHAFRGKYGQVKHDNAPNGGGKNGQILMIDLASLPLNAQVAYLKSHGQEFQIEQIEIPDADLWEKSPDWKRQVAAERLAILASWDKFLAAHPEGNKTDLTKEFIGTWLVKSDQNKLSLQTLYRWQKAYRDGGRCALLPGWGDTKRERAIDPQAYQFFCKIYNTLQKRTIADCYADLVLVAEEKGWRIPSLRTLQRIVQEDMPESTKILFREGEEAFRNKCQPYILRDPESVKGNEVWVGDHHQFDLFCVGPNGKPVRPWITAWLDFRSWMLVGWNINYGPNTDTITAAFSEGALDKTIGLPSDILIDNGRDYSSKEFAGRGNRKKAVVVDENAIRTMVSDLGIVPHFAIPKNARAKTIERFFGIVAQKFSKRFPTYCGSNIEERPEGLEELLKNHPEKIPTLQEIQQAFKDWVTYVYHQLPSEGAGRKGETPIQTFERTRGPLRIASESVLRLYLMRHSQSVTVTGNGVQLFGRYYQNDDLIALHLGEKVFLRYRDADMTKVHVFSIEGVHLCDAEIENKTAVLGATKDDIRETNRRVKRIRKTAAEQMKFDKEIEEEPDDLAYVISKRKAAVTQTKPEPPKVIQPVRVSKQLNEASQAIFKSITESERQIAVGGGYVQTYEQRREAERERIRESMEAVRRSMSMSKK